jgi:hypothetical protein
MNCLNRSGFSTVAGFQFGFKFGSIIRQHNTGQAQILAFFGRQIASQVCPEFGPDALKFQA